MSIQGNTAIESGNNPSAAASALVSDAGGAAHECPSPVLTADRHPWDAFHRVEMLLIAILAAFLSMLVAGEMFAASKSPAPGNLPVLNQVAQIRRLPPEQSGRGYPVKLRGVITYSVPEWGVTFFQDATAGIFIWGSSSLAKVRPGNLVEIRGKTAPGDFAPVVDQPEVQVLGQTRLPSAHRFTLEDLFAGQEDSQWVEVRGIVHSVGLAQWIKPDLRKAAPSLVLEIAWGGRKFDAWIGDAPKGANYQDLVDKDVTVRGVCGTESNEKRQLVAVHLFVPKMEQVRVDERGASHDELTVSPMVSLMQFTPGQASGHRIRLQGNVTLDLPGRRVFVQDSTGGVMVESKQTTGVEPGDRVEVLGFPIAGKYEPVLEDATVQKIGRGTLPPPFDLTRATSLAGGHDADLVKVRGRLMNKHVEDKSIVLDLQTGSLTYSARLEGGAARAEAATISIGSLLEITGVLSMEAPEEPNPVAFHVLVRSARDIVVVERPSWWTVSRIFGLLGILAAVTLGSATWVVLLRKRVDEQTKAIRTSEAKLQIIFEGVEAGVFLIDLETHRIVEANPQALSLVGAPREQVVGAICHRFVCPANEGRCPVTDLGQTVDNSERLLLAAAGKRLPIIKTVRPVVIAGRQLLLESFVDISARKEAEDALRESEDRYRDWVESSSLLIGTHDAQGRILNVNSSSATYMGSPQRRSVGGAPADGLCSSRTPRQVCGLPHRHPRRGSCRRFNGARQPQRQEKNHRVPQHATPPGREGTDHPLDGPRCDGTPPGGRGATGFRESLPAPFPPQCGRAVALCAGGSNPGLQRIDGPHGGLRLSPGIDWR